MSYLDNLLIHPAVPVRAIELYQIPRSADFQARYRGDQWTEAFITRPGKRCLVREAAKRIDVGHGLPIIDSAPPRDIYGDRDRDAVSKGRAV